MDTVQSPCALTLCRGNKSVRAMAFRRVDVSADATVLPENLVGERVKEIKVVAGGFYRATPCYRGICRSRVSVCLSKVGVLLKRLNARKQQASK